MAQSGNFTPILLYASSTPGNIPAAGNLTNSADGSETGINIADGRLFYKDPSNNVQKIADKTWVGTVTSVAALTLGTTGTDLSSTVANGTSTPVITLNVPTASATNRGALSSTDWSTFNGKQATLVSGTNIKTVSGVSLLGSGDVGTIGIAYGGTGKTSFTANQIIYGSAFSQSSSLTFDGTTLGIGTGAANQGILLNSIASGTNGGGYLIIQNNGSSIIGIGNKSSIIGGAYNATSYLYFPTSLQIGSSSTPVATLFTSGGVSIGNTTDPGAGNLNINSRLFVGCTSLPASNRTNGFAANQSGIGGMQIYQSSNGTEWAINATSGSVSNFYSDNGSALVFAGQILVNGNITGYTSVSDYRLKENIVPMVGALATIAQLNPVTYTFKDGGQKSQGFIAHELQAVVPDCVTGEKDAVKEDGTPNYQGVDTSFLVATLTAAIQELNSKFDAYVASHP